MTLPPPAPREPIHERRVVCRGHRRADQLWDIEGHLLDTKGYAFDNEHRGRIEAGEPVHDMALRLTVDDELTIVEAVASMDAHPYGVCPAVAPAFSALAGLRIGPGFRRAVLERLGGVHGCTHLLELVWPLATAAYQTVVPLRARREETDPERPPGHLDRCHALRRDGEVVRRHHPRWYTGDGDAGA